MNKDDLKKSPTQQRAHLGVYGVITNETLSSLLLIRKSRGPYMGMWDLPGGTPEFTETFYETLVREIEEETGLQILEAQQLTCMLTIFPWGDTLFRHTGIVYTCTIGNKERIKTTPDGHDSDGCAWITIDELEDDTLCSPFVYQTAQLLKKLKS